MLGITLAASRNRDNSHRNGFPCPSVAVQFESFANFVKSRGHGVSGFRVESGLVNQKRHNRRHVQILPIAELLSINTYETYV
jgi:hypothetical protein